MIMSTRCVVLVRAMSYHGANARTPSWAGNDGMIPFASHKAFCPIRVCLWGSNFFMQRDQWHSRAGSPGEPVRLGFLYLIQNTITPGWTEANNHNNSTDRLNPKGNNIDIECTLNSYHRLTQKLEFDSAKS